jgi:predicted transcriptional regulator
MDTGKLIQINTELIQCITHIEDFLEYQYELYDKQEIQKKIMNYIDELTEKLKTIQGETNEQSVGSIPESKFYYC